MKNLLIKNFSILCVLVFISLFFIEVPTVFAATASDSVTVTVTATPTGTYSYPSVCPTACGSASSNQTQTCTGGNEVCSGTADERTCDAVSCTGTYSYPSACPTACGSTQTDQTQTCTGGNEVCSGTADERTCDAVSCTGTYSYPACPTACGSASSNQTQTCTGGNGVCSGTAGTRTCSATNACTCSAPLSQTQTVQCSSRSSAWTGTITQTSTKSSYASGCTWSGWTDTSNNCSCAAPSYELRTVNCPTGYSGSITEERDKGAYSACSFGSWYQTYDGCTVNSYSITFNSAGGSSVSTITKNYGTSVTAPASPTRYGYTFAGWSPSIASTMPVGGQSLTATWTALTGSCTGTNTCNSACSSICTTSGTWSSGSCIVSAPANPSYYGQACTGATSSQNVCGQTNTGGAGTYQCAGTTAQSNCSGATGTTPPNSNCSYTLTVNTAGTGSGTVGGVGSKTYGTTATATASASADSYFAGWSGSCNSSGQVYMDGAKTCTATFTKTPINGQCGTSNGMSFYVSPTSGYCSSGTYSGISGSGPWTWSCAGLYLGTTASCSAKKAVDCVGSWSDTATCSLTCGGGVKQQVYTITTNLANGGNACPSTNGATRWGSTSCNTVCCAPTSQTQTVQCSSRSSAWTGTITQTSTKSSYASGCTWSGWTDTSNNCSCALPSYELQTVSCPTGYSGSITQERDKGAYSTCSFGGWYQTYDGCTINTYTLTVNTAGTGSGTVGGGGTKNYGTTATATQSASGDSYFAGWSGSCNASGQVYIDGPKTCTATFTKNPINCVGGWSTCSGGTETYNITTASNWGGNACPYTNGLVWACGTTAVCSGTHYGCSPGTSVSNSSNLSTWTWGCNSTDGGVNALSCSEGKPAPTAWITVTPASVAYNAQSTLSWGSSNATSCTATGPWSNSGTLSGSGLTNTLTANTTFSIQCTGNGQTSAVQSVTVGVSALNGSCGSSNGMSFYVAPTSWYCNAGTYSGISGSGPWTWSCGGLNGGTTASCSASKAVDCVGSWGACSGGSQTFTITTATANGGTACIPATTGSTQACGTGAYLTPASSWNTCTNGSQTRTCTEATGGGAPTCAARGYSVGTNNQSCGVNGGWSGWSAQNLSCAYTTETRTQTRTCTNPTPSGGGRDCSAIDEGNSTKTYTVVACSSNITALSISPTTVAYGSTANISYSCSNGYYSHIILDGVWDWQDSAYYSSRTVATPAQIVPGSHYAMAYCYNSDWIPSANSWSYVYYTVSNAPTPTPDLKVTAWGYSNADGSIETYTGSPTTISWGAVPNATSCTLDGTSASISGGSRNSTATVRSESHTLTCTNVTGQSASDSVTIVTPPDPTAVTYSCSADAMTATANWNTSLGYNTFYTRTSSGYNNDGVVGTSYSFPISPNTDYDFWVHTRTPANGAWSNAIHTYPRCNRSHSLTVNTTGNGSGTVGGAGTYPYNQLVTATASPAGSSNFTGWTGDCNASGQVTMNSNKVCIATFTLKTYTLSYGANTGGSISGSTSQTINYGANGAAVTAVPSTGYIFGSWSDGVTTATRTDTNITANKSVTASFTAVTISVTATTPYTKNLNEGISFSYTPTTNTGGTECRLLDSASSALTSYQASGPISYSAPSSAGAYGYYIQCRNSTHTTVTATSNQIIVYVNATLSVGTAGNGSGVVTSNPAGISCQSDCSEIYNYNTSVTLTASPTAGSYFASWSGACSGTGTCTVGMTVARSVTATFTLNIYSLTINKIGTGAGTVTGAGTYNHGTTVTATASPNGDSTFSGWGGNCNSSGQVYMDGAKTCTATFTKRAVITSLSVTPVVAYGATATINFASTDGYYCHVILDGSWAWEDSGYFGSRTSTTPAQTVPGSHSAWVYCYNSDWGAPLSGWVTVPFVVNNAPTPTPDLKVTAWGSTNADGSIETYTGSPTTLSWAAVPNATSCTLDGTSASISGGSRNSTVTVRSESHTLTCTNVTGQSASDSVTITTPPMPTNVTTSCSADSLTANVSWTAPGGYNTFYTRTSSGYNNDNVVATSYSFPISPNTNYSFWVHTKNTSNGAWSTEVYSATINCVRTHTLTYTAGAGGSISGSASQTINYMANGTAVTAVPNAGYFFATWSDGVTTATRTETNVTSNKAVSASFTSGTLSSSNCIIPLNGTTCNTNLVWSTTNPIGTSAVTTPTSITVQSSNSSAGTSYPVYYGTRTFYLYNNGNELKNAIATASCINGTTWDGAKCAPITMTLTAASMNIAYNTATTLNWSVANATSCIASGGWSGSKATSGSVSTGNLQALTTFTLSCTGLNGTNGTASVTVIVQSFGTLTASNCTILPAQNKCNTNLVWNTYNPLATSAVTTPTNITVASANSSSGTPYSVDYGTRDFYLYNNGVLLATATARASCEQFWDVASGTCAVVPTLTSPTSSTVSALSAKVGGTITNLGTPASISERGVCYSSTMQNPGINNNGNGAICGKDGNNTNDGSFMIHLVKILSPNTTYYYRAYAINIAGAGYSPQGTFTTLILPPEATVIEFKEIANKTQIEFGESVNLTWNSTDAYYGCTMTSNFAPATNIISSLEPNTKTGNITLKPTKTTVYTLICSGEGGTSPASQVQIKVGKINPTYNEF